MTELDRLTDPQQTDAEYDGDATTAVVVVAHLTQFLSSPVAEQVRVASAQRWRTGQHVRQAAAGRVATRPCSAAAAVAAAVARVAGRRRRLQRVAAR